MNSLVVVHAETGYLDPEETSRSAAKKARKLFDRIGREVGAYLQEGQRVYFLGEKSDSARSPLIYRGIRRYASGLRHIPYGILFEEQCLRTKEALMEEGSGIALVGVAYDASVSGLHAFLRGQEWPGYTTRKRFEICRQELEWPAEKFERVFREQLDARIWNELTDKDW
jgi:hypothetical protein